MNSNGTNSWHRNGAIGVSDPLPGTAPEEASGDPFANAYVAFEGEAGETGDARNSSSMQRSGCRRKRVIGGLLCVLLVAITSLCLWIAFGDRGKTKINLPVRDVNARAANPADARNPEDVTAEAIAEVRSSAPAPSPVVATSPPPAASVITPATPVTIPLETIGGTVSSPARDAISETSQSINSTATARPRAASIASERNPERSIRCAASALPPGSRSIAGPESSARSAGNSSREPEALLATPTLVKPAAVLPSFGTLLPVRTLGAIYTLRSGSLARLELTRDVRASGWEMKKGTTLIGRQQGGEYDRAYISLLGFIDPASGRLVKVGGDVMGTDGAPGLRGKRRQVSSRWTRVLGRAATSAVSLGQAALSRGGATVILPGGGIGPELSPGFNAISRREFVEIPAGASGYVMITDLPNETQGVDADPLARTDGEKLADEELAELLSSGSPEKIRAALPRMTPELRRIAESVVKGQDR
ncbi:MAG: hypothetical protein ACREEM_37780 [Blastocatellia bacterium]